MQGANRPVRQLSSEPESQWGSELVRVERVTAVGKRLPGCRVNIWDANEIVDIALLEIQKMKPQMRYWRTFALILEQDAAAVCAVGYRKLPPQVRDGNKVNTYKTRNVESICRYIVILL